MIYSLAPSGHIDTGKTCPVCTVRLRVVGRRACIWPGSKRTHARGKILAPRERIDTGKTWPVYTATRSWASCWHIHVVQCTCTCVAWVQANACAWQDQRYD